MIPGSANPLLLASAASSPAPSYQIERSLRFNSSDSAFLSRTPASAGNRKKWTWAGWVKRSGLSSTQRIFSSSNSGNTEGFYCELVSGDTLSLYDYSNPTIFWQKTTSQVFRDASAWFHLQVAFDSTNATAGDRVKIYVTGVPVTAFGTSTNPSLNYDSYWNAARVHAIGRTGDSNAGYFNGYLADVHFIDGQALDPTSFGEFDTNGVWQPKAYTGTYGTNGFHLPFSDNSTAAALGTDTSGNGNDWTVNNLSVGAGPDYTNSADWTLGGPSATGRTVVSQSRFFDGSTGTGPTWSGGNTGWYEENWLQWNAGSNPIPVPPGATVEIWMPSSYSESIYRSVYRVTVNGSTYTMPFNTASTWVDVTAAAGSSITSIRFSAYNYLDGGGTSISPGPPSGPNAIRINGTILVAPGTTDSLVDTPTSYGTDTGAGGEVRGNYCTLNPLTSSANFTISNGSLDIADSGSSAPVVLGTIAVNSGKWYWEVTLGNGIAYVGAAKVTATGVAGWLGSIDGSFMYNPATPSSSYINGTIYTYGSTISGAADTIGVALDFDTNTVVMYKNGVSLGTFGSNLLGADTWTPAFKSNGGTSAVFNFGQRPFAYTAPSGFKALCDTNLPEPVVAKPSEVMDVVTYTGTGASRSITGLGFSPDFVWIKERGAVGGHNSYDTVRGASIYLASESTNAEGTDTDALTAFNSDGFSLGSGYTVKSANGSGRSYVAWTWDAGSSTVTLNPGDPGAGSITSQVRANPSAGFSIVTATISNVQGSIGHGLGVAPALIIGKNRQNSGTSWPVYHSSMGATDYLLLNTTAAKATSSTIWNGVTSTAFTQGGGWTSSPYDHIFYCFAPVDGYSAFGSYTGNGSGDGPAVFTSMRPRFLLIKRTDTAANWLMYDSERDQFNSVKAQLYPNSSSAENPGNDLDFLSNGFKLRTTNTALNASAGTYIYAAFAEHPFQYARAR